jgi:high mobility group protein B1
MDQSAIMKAEGNMTFVEGGKRANKTRKNKQEGGKRKLSGYMKFANKMRPQLMKDNPGMKVPQMGKKLGEMWGKLSDSEKKSHA